MALAGWQGAFVLGKYNLTPYLSKVTPTQATDKADTSVLGSQYKSSVPGQYAAGFGLTGWFDPAVGAYSEAISTYMAGLGTGTATTAILCFPTSGAVGDPAFLLNGWVGTKNLDVAVTGAVPLVSEVNGQGPMDGGVLLTTQVAQSVAITTTNGYVQNVPGATTGGWAAILACHTITGADPQVTVTLEHCTTAGGAYVTFCTFTLRTAAGFEYKTGTTNPLNAFVRAVITFAGTTATFVSTIAVARR